MALLNSDDFFDPDTSGQLVVGIAAEVGRHDSGFHQHALGQLLFTQGGCIHFMSTNRLCMLPPSSAVWIPPHTLHRAETLETVAYRSIYLDVDQKSVMPDRVGVFGVTPLLRAILEKIALADFNTCWNEGPSARLLAVCLDELHAARQTPAMLPLPADRRLNRLETQTLPPPLKMLASQVGASEKTIGRIFRRETGLNYQQWRQQWRLMKAIELLAKGERTSTIASTLEFSSDSAFIAFFKQMTGSTPGAYSTS